MDSTKLQMMELSCKFHNVLHCFTLMIRKCKVNGKILNVFCYVDDVWVYKQYSKGGLEQMNMFYCLAERHHAPGSRQTDSQYINIFEISP